MQVKRTLKIPPLHNIAMLLVKFHTPPPFSAPCCDNHAATVVGVPLMCWCLKCKRQFNPSCAWSQYCRLPWHHLTGATFLLWLVLFYFQL